MVELQAAGVQVLTVNANVQRDPGQIIAASQVIISVVDSQPVPPVDSTIAAHNASAAMAAEQSARTTAKQNTVAAAAKLRAFYKVTVGLTDEEIDDSKILDHLESK